MKKKKKKKKEGRKKKKRKSRVLIFPFFYPLIPLHLLTTLSIPTILISWYIHFPTQAFHLSLHLHHH